MDEEIRILFVDDEKGVLKSIRRLFLDDDYDILVASSGEEGLEVLDAENSIQIVISDYKMPGMDGVSFLREVCRRWPETVRIVFSGYADVAAVVAAINEGQIYKFIPKPWRDEEMKLVISNAIDYYRLYKKNIYLNRELENKNRELRVMNENLELLVARRTAELEFHNKVLTRSQNILDALPVGVIGIASDDMIVQCNSKGIELLSKEGNSFIGLDRQDVFSEEINNFIEKTIETGYLSENIKKEEQLLKLKGIFMRYEDQQKGIILVVDEETGI